ncbi:hypothetical protein KDM41_12290 [bacterium]|nr:hypothetical protein [bacterium]
MPRETARSRRRRRAAALGLALAAGLVLAAGGLRAQALGEPLFVTGFISQGYLNTSENDYLVPRSVNGTAEFTEAALTLVARPMDRLRVGMQLLARNFGDTGNGQVVVDWAYGDYAWRDQLGFRAGKVKLPFGFYNEGRDVDMLRTSVFLPQAIYNEKMRDFILAYEGIGAYGNVTVAGLGELDYHVYGGTLNVPDPTRGFWNEAYTEAARDIEDGVAALVADETGAQVEAEFRALDNETVSFPWIYGGALIWSTPVEGLRAGVSALAGRFNFQGDLSYDTRLDFGGTPPQVEYRPFGLHLDETVQIDHIAVLSAEWARDRWSLASEYYHDDFEGVKAIGWYVQGGWQASDRLALGLTYGDLQQDQFGGADAGLPDYYGWQRDWTVSLRFDINDHWLFKLERHFIDGVALAQPRSVAEDLADPLQQSWGLFAAKTTFHF